MNWLLDPITHLLNWIICLIQKFLYLIADGIIWAVNELVRMLALLLVTILATLPSMPGSPSLPAPFTTALGWINWVWPVNTTVDIFAFLFGAWLVWLIVSMVLQWGKAKPQ